MAPSSVLRLKAERTRLAGPRPWGDSAWLDCWLWCAMAAFPYRIVTGWSDEDQVFVSRVPALPGCAAHGDSPERAAKEARIAATGILESMTEHGDPIPEPDA